MYYSTVLVDMAEPPFPSVADGFYLVYHPAVYAAVLLLIRSQVQRFYPSMVLDGLVAGLGAAALALAPGLRRPAVGAPQQAVSPGHARARGGSSTAGSSRCRWSAPLPA